MQGLLHNHQNVFFKCVITWKNKYNNEWGKGEILLNINCRDTTSFLQPKIERDETWTISSFPLLSIYSITIHYVANLKTGSGERT